MKYDQNNFYENTTAYFKGCKRPRRRPDYVSYNRRGRISSCYWYTPKGVIRASNHWSALFLGQTGNSRRADDNDSQIIQCGKVASCVWSLRSTKDDQVLCGFCKWENFRPAYILKNGVYVILS